MPSFHELTAVQQALYLAVQSKSGWLSRTDIAEIVGVEPRSFGRHYWQALDYLAEIGFIERRVEKRGIVMKAYCYKAKEQLRTILAMSGVKLD